MLTFDYYLDKALELGKKSYFTSKAQQKDALDYLNRAYDCLRDTKVYKSSTPQERWLETYDLPMSLHHVKEKHRTVFQNLSIDCDLVYKLVQCRNDFKNTVSLVFKQIRFCGYLFAIYNSKRSAKT